MSLANYISNIAGRAANPFGAILAGAVVLAAPAVALFVAFQKHFTAAELGSRGEGMTSIPTALEEPHVHHPFAAVRHGVAARDRRAAGLPLTALARRRRPRHAGAAPAAAPQGRLTNLAHLDFLSVTR